MTAVIQLLVGVIMVLISLSNLREENPDLSWYISDLMAGTALVFIGIMLILLRWTKD